MSNQMIEIFGKGSWLFKEWKTSIVQYITFIMSKFSSFVKARSSVWFSLVAASNKERERT
jgi:hypothetical protein